MQKIVLNHDGESVHEFFNMKKEDFDRIRTLVIFETFKGYLLSDELYDGDDNITPRNLITKSGCLERCLEHLTNEKERYLLFFTFISSHEFAGKSYQAYSKLTKHLDEYVNETNGNDIDSKLKKLMIEKLKNDVKDRFNIVGDIINYIRLSKYNFDNFFMMISEEIEGDIASIIKKSIDGNNNENDSQDED